MLYCVENLDYIVLYDILSITVLITNISKVRYLSFIKIIIIKSYRFAKVKSLKNSNAPERAIFASIDDPSRYSIITCSLCVLREARLRISSANYPIKQHLACAVSTHVRVHTIRRWGRFVVQRSRSRNAIKECITPGRCIVFR